MQLPNFFKPGTDVNVAPIRGFDSSRYTIIGADLMSAYVPHGCRVQVPRKGGSHSGTHENPVGNNSYRQAEIT
jgi:hypothetical protein